MNMRTWLTIAVGLILNLGSATFAAEPDSARIAEARKGIDAGNAQWIMAHKTSDARLLASLFTPDGALLVRGGQFIQRPGTIEKEMGDYMTKVGPVDMTITTLEVWVIDSTAYEYGKFTRRFLKSGSDTTTFRGRYFEIWQQQPDGGWKIQRDVGLPNE